MFQSNNKLTPSSDVNNSVAKNHVIKVHNESVSDSLNEVNCPITASYPVVDKHMPSNVSVGLYVGLCVILEQFQIII